MPRVLHRTTSLAPQSGFYVYFDFLGQEAYLLVLWGLCDDARTKLGPPWASKNVLSPLSYLSVPLIWTFVYCGVIIVVFRRMVL